MRDPVRTFRASDEEWLLARVGARARGVTVSKFVRQAIKAEVERELKTKERAA